MIEKRADCLAVTVPLVMANARGLLDAGRALLQPGEVVFDLAAAVEADSSAVAVMLGLVRAAPSRGASVKFSNVPAGVRSLAELYGVAELISLA
jgi:phospholipid transport system transporter-binding protein